MNVFDALERAQIRFPNKAAVLFKGQRITYGDLYEQVCRLSAALSRCFQLRRGDRVAIFLPNTPEFITCYYAVEKLGAIAVALNVMLKRDEVEFIVRDCSPRVLITVPQFLDQVPEGIATLAGIVVVGETNRPGCMKFSDLLSERPTSGRARCPCGKRGWRGDPLYFRDHRPSERSSADPRQSQVQLPSDALSYPNDRGRPAALLSALVSLLRPELHYEHLGACRRYAAAARALYSG